MARPHNLRIAHPARQSYLRRSQSTGRRKRCRPGALSTGRREPGLAPPATAARPAAREQQRPGLVAPPRRGPLRARSMSPRAAGRSRKVPEEGPAIPLPPGGSPAPETGPRGHNVINCVFRRAVPRRVVRAARGPRGYRTSGWLQLESGKSSASRALGRSDGQRFRHLHAASALPPSHV